MLFILGMDVLNLMVAKASNEGLLQPLSSRSIQHRISFVQMMSCFSFGRLLVI
jgi:hypothetical protein